VTTAWFLVGTLAGVSPRRRGPVLARAGFASRPVRQKPPAALLVALLAAATAVVDEGVLGVSTAFFLRQVTKAGSTATGRGSTAAASAGRSVPGHTYIMTAAVFLTVAVARARATPWAAVGLCVLVRLVRGCAVFVTAGRHSNRELFALHRRFDPSPSPCDAR